MQLYKLIYNTWNKAINRLLQRARNIQTIVDALVYSRTRLSKLCSKAQMWHHAIPKLCKSTLVKTILHAHLDNLIIAPTTDDPKINTTQQPLPC